MECSEELKPLLAGFVDGELTAVEQQAVEEHVGKCEACRELLDEQRAAAEAYARYAIEEVSDDQWGAMWAKLDPELPKPAKRVDLESLASVATDDEGAAELPDEPEAADATEGEASVPGVVTESPEVADEEADASPAAEAKADEAEEETVVRLPKKRPKRPRVFKPLRFRRMRHTVWAHAAGIAACLLVAAMVFLSIKPVIRVDEFARSDEVVVELVMSDNPRAMPRQMTLHADGGGQIPLVWIVDITDDGMIIEEGIR
jgi:Putative zinc-finger